MTEDALCFTHRERQSTIPVNLHYNKRRSVCYQLFWHHIFLLLTYRQIGMNAHPSTTIHPVNPATLESAEHQINPQITRQEGPAEDTVKESNSSGAVPKGEKPQTLPKKIDEIEHTESNCKLPTKQTGKKVSVMESCSTAKPAKQHLDSIQESHPQNYLSLTNTLEKALHKISSTKKIVNKTTVNPQDKTVAKGEKNEEKTRITDHRREQLLQHLKKQLKEKPTIDKNSQRIAKEMGHTSIVSRLDRLVEDKKRRLKQNEELKKKQQEEEQQQFIEQYNRHAKKPQKLRSYEQYFNEMVRWKAKREEQNQQKLELQKSKELDGLTFQPTLNAMSKKLASSHHRLPIEQRYKAKKTGELNRSSQVIPTEPETQQ